MNDQPSSSGTADGISPEKKNPIGKEIHFLFIGCSEINIVYIRIWAARLFYIIHCFPCFVNNR